MTQLKCAPGNKPCGKRCIPKAHKCRSQGEGDESGGIGNQVKKAVGGVKDTLGNAVEGVKDTVGDAAKGVKDTLGNTVEGVKDAVGDAAKGVKDLAKDAKEGFDKMSTTKKVALVAGAGLAAVAGGALIYGINTGKVKLPSGQELNPFNSQEGQMMLDKMNPYSHMNQSDRQRRAAEGDNVAYNQQQVLDGLQKLSQPVSEQAEKAFEKVNSGFSAIQKAILDSDGNFSMDLTAESLGNMANGIIDSSKNAATALSATIQAQSTLMMASLKENLKAAGVNIKAVMESTKSGFKSLEGKINFALDDNWTPSQKLENLKNIAGHYLQGGREFARQKMQETMSAAKDIGGKAKGFAQGVGKSAMDAYNTSGARQTVEGVTGLAKDATEGAIEFFQDFHANLFESGANIISQFGNSWQDGAKAFFGAVGSIFAAPTNGVSKELGGFAGSYVGIEGKAKADALAENIRSKAPAKQERARQINLFGGSQKVENAKPQSEPKPKKKKKEENPDQLSLDLWG